jgi:protein Tex
VNAPPSGFESWLQRLHPGTPSRGAAAVLRLASAGGTVPFIARYRKEETGNLDEVAIRHVLEAKERWDQILARQSFILETIDRQKKLTPELRGRVLATFDADELEDLYLPYKPKRQTKAAAAREAGLGPLADWIWSCGHGTDVPEPGQTLGIWAYTFRNPAKGIADAEAALRGAQDILTERIAEIPRLRRIARARVLEEGCLRSRKGPSARPASKYEKYFGLSEPIAVLRQAQASHRYLAMRRGAAEGELALSVGGPAGEDRLEAELRAAFEAAACTVADSPGEAVLLAAARTALDDHVLPAIESEIHRTLKAVADEAAIEVFASNVRRLLLEAPLGPKTVLGVDPGVRSGCKAAVVDGTGRFVKSAVLHLESEAGRSAAGPELERLLAEPRVEAVAVGNGTGGREAEAFLRAALRGLGHDAPVVMVSEAGASVYSASDLAREELPGSDVTERGAVSIARRLQDPLAELVKIDPKSLGVGQYQHDVPSHLLRHGLEQVVESCVNEVGVNLNTASEPLLAHVSGIGPALAKAVLERRTSLGLFRTRAELIQVPRFGKKAFEQSAGFLRIPNGDNPLDNTGVHPERYATLEGVASRLGVDTAALLGDGAAQVASDAALKEQLGEFTFRDVVEELRKPGRDPREGFVAFSYREDVRELKDLQPGMQLPGIVTNVTNFGAFVDVGVHQDGLVHVSQVSDRFVRDPREVVRPGARVTVRVLDVNREKKQIALTMKAAPAPRPKQAAPKADRPARPARRPPRGAHAIGPKPSVPATAGNGTAGPAARQPATAPPPRSAPTPRPRPTGRAAEKPAAAKPAASRTSVSGAGRFVNNPFAVLAGLKKDIKGGGR